MWITVVICAKLHLWSESYPHPISERLMNFTYPQKMWISYPHYPQGVDSFFSLREPGELSTFFVDKLSTLARKWG
jgi:hypothetical protein